MPDAPSGQAAGEMVWPLGDGAPRNNAEQEYFGRDAIGREPPWISERYWFWTGVGSKETLEGNWRRTFRRLCNIAGVHNGHPHRFRDTLAVELLLDGVPIERVSVLLGHSSVKITERHYAPWVQARQVQLESDLVQAWRNDPIAQAEILYSETPSPAVSQ